MGNMTLKLVAESSVETGKWIIEGARMSRIRKSKGLSRGKAAKMLEKSAIITKRGKGGGTYA